MQFNLRDDVSGKRFSTHVGEGNVARIGEGRCGNDKGMESVSGSDVRLRRVAAVGLGTGQDKISHAGCTDTWQCHVGSVTGHCYRVLSRDTNHRVSTQDTVTGHPSLEALPRISATDKCRGSTSQRHINKDTPDDFSSGVSEERQLPTLPPGLAVPSAMTGLASLFGMGRGGSPSL